MTPKGEWLETRWSLISRIKDLEDQDSWQEFFDIYWRLIYSVALKAGLRDAEAQEVVQNTVIFVSRNIGSFKTTSDKGSFKGWLLMVTRWKIGDQFKKRKTRREREEVPRGDGAETDVLERLPENDNESWESIWDAEWAVNLTARALEKLGEFCNPKHLQIFRMLIVEDQSPQQVAQTLDVSPAQVYLVRHRLTRRFREILKELESQDADRS